MSSRVLRRMVLVSGVVTVALITSRQTYAQSGETITPTTASGTGSLTVEQVTKDEMYGTWTLLKPGNTQTSGSGKVAPGMMLGAGTYTIIINPPEGAVATLRLYNRDAEVKLLERQQMTFSVADGDALKLTINYSFTLVGLVSVQSDPSGLEFTLTGPNNIKQQGVTPYSLENAPAGQYKVQYGTLDGCVLPAPKALNLEKEKRVTFDLTLSCDAADTLRKRQKTSDDKYVTNTVEGQSITFRDVPQGAWFADSVFKAAKRGVIGGYKNADGELTGEFGPGNNVTVGELAKIAHKIAGLEETAASEPRNIMAQGQWFGGFIASAEERGWTIYIDGTIDPTRFATRGEVMVTLMQALNVPLKWQKGAVFTDVSVRLPYASAIETAAGLKIVEGRKGDDGKLTGEFGPGEFINRAELAKIIVTAMDTLVGK
jgi:hypothetical protein